MKKVLFQVEIKDRAYRGNNETLLGMASSVAEAESRAKRYAKRELMFSRPYAKSVTRIQRLNF